jgi:hypothetical protein
MNKDEKFYTREGFSELYPIEEAEREWNAAKDTEKRAIRRPVDLSRRRGGGRRKKTKNKTKKRKYK